MIDRKFVEILRCPVSRQPVAVLPKDRLRTLNAAIAAGQLQHADGRKVERRSMAPSRPRTAHASTRPGRHPDHAGRRGHHAGREQAG
jgi:uncharacterized protein YbaR (Trm112 family)